MKNSVLEKIEKAVPSKNFKYVLYVVLSAIQAGLSVIFALAVKELINSVENSNSLPIIYPAVTLVAIVLLTYVLGVIVRLMGDKLQITAEKRLKDIVLSAFIKSDYATVSKLSSGDLVSRLDGDVTKVASVKTNLLPNIVATFVRLLCTAVALFILQPIFTLVILGVAVVIVASSFVVRKIVYSLHGASRVENSKQSSYISEVSNNALAIKAFNAEDTAIKISNERFDSYKKAKLKERYFSSFVNSVINLCFTAFYTATAIYGVYGISKGINGINFGVITAMLQLVLQIRSPISGISGFFTAHAEMLVSGARLFELSSTVEEKLEVTDFDKISVSDLSFSYGDGEVLTGVSFEIEKGDILLVKGGSGEGKSTLAKVLCGLYSVSGGEIKVVLSNDKYSPDKIKGLYSFVPQGNMIFSGSVKENVIFNSEYDEERLKLALKTACIYSTVDSFEFKEDTLLNDKFRLSEGQEQRLAIARAVYSNSPIIILDEPTSALDSKTEEEVAKSLSTLGKTLIVISHKPAFEKYATKTITVDGGKII
ncbi:MAG: ABC transporter ATP-binding protein [Clostridia bacterium]|nr:ABC transporter ATP-binding protein [Clostridia bacterium]